MITCRGDKCFNLYEASAYPLGGKVAVRMEYKRPYESIPPISFSGPKAEMVALLGSLKAMAEGGPCGLFDLRGTASSDATKCKGGNNPELCGYCLHKMQEEVAQ